MEEIFAMKKTMQFRVGGFLLLTTFAGVTLSGCGGGSSNTTSRSAPTAATRTRMAHLLGRQSNAMNLTGFQSNAAMSMTPSGGSGEADGIPPNANSSVASNIGGYFRYHLLPIFGGGANTNSRAYHAPKSKHTRDGDSGSSGGSAGGAGGGGDYDDYLGYYQTVVETPGRREVTLFLDAAKTQSAGNILMVFPVDYLTFPQVYEYSYTFTAGSQNGSHGSYNSTYNVDGTGSTTYNAVDASGLSYRGSYASTSAGYTWTSVSTQGNSSWQDSGNFLTDGSGTMTSSGSDGYRSTYLYKADGSYTGTIEGPDPGLPATITYTVDGKYTIRYADGTTETFDYGYWGGISLLEGDTGNAGTGESAGGTTTNASSPSTTGR